MKNIIKQKEYLDVLRTAPPTMRKAILSNASPELRSAIIEIVVNVLAGKVQLTPSQKKRISKYKTSMRNLCRTCFKNNKFVNMNSKIAKRSVNQIGGILPFLLPLLPLIGKAIAGGVASAAAGYATKKVIDAATN